MKSMKAESEAWFDKMCLLRDRDAGSSSSLCGFLRFGVDEGKGLLAALLMAVIVLLGLSVPVFASESGDTENETVTEIESSDYTWTPTTTDADSDTDSDSDSDEDSDSSSSGISVSGNTITITANGTLTLNDDITAVIEIAPDNGSNNTSDDAITVTIDLNGHTLTAYTSSDDDNSTSSAIYTGYYVDLTITDSSTNQSGVITGGTGTTVGSTLRGGAICTGYYCTVTMTGGTIRDCSAGYGGAVFIGGYGTFVMTGGTITDCSATYGGAVYGGVYGKTSIESGTISECKASSYGGGVFVSSGTFNMTDGTITSCTATYYGGGVYLRNGASGTLTGGTISSCSASTYGGGVFVNSGTFVANNGTIANCSAGYGGGVYLYNTSGTLSGGTISSCTASSNGGGIYAHEGTLSVSDGTVSSCTAKNGGGICVYVSSGDVTFNMTGGTITNCTATRSDGENSFGGGLYLHTGSSSSSSEDSSDGSSSDSDESAATLAATMSGGTISDCTVSVSNRQAFGGGIAMYGDGVSLEMTGGTISGCEATNEGNTNQESLGGGISVSYGGSLLVSGGTISGNSSDTVGGGIYVHNNAGSAVLYNTVIYDNTASILGGGVWCCPNGSLNMYVTKGGAVIGNTAGTSSDSSETSSSGSSIQAAGDDIAFVYDSSYGTMTLEDSILGGGTVSYYHDGGISTSSLDKGYGDLTTYNRYSTDSSSNSELTNLAGIAESVALITVATSEDAQSNAVSAAEAVITGNSAQWGGGVATNTGLDIGDSDSEKDSAPGIEKKILVDENGDGEIDANEEFDSYSVEAGNIVTFRLTSNVPDYLLKYITFGYTSDDEDEETGESTVAAASADNGIATIAATATSGTYVITFHDVLDSSFILNTSSFTVTIGGKTIPSDYYTLVFSGDTDSDGDTVITDGCTFELSIDLAALYIAGIIDDDDVSDAAEIVVTYEATLSGSATAGKYTNQAWVEYEGTTTDKPDVDVYVYGIKIYKIDEDGTTETTDKDGTVTTVYTYLEGAEFTLYSDSSLGNDCIVKTLETDEDGYLCFDGLAAGTYYLVETDAPDGYVGSTAAVTITLPENDDSVTSYYYKSIINNAAIPNTGGMGTTILYIIGAALVLCAGIILVTRRRMNEDGE